MKGWSDALSRITSSAPPLSSTTGAELSERRVDLESQVEELEILEREIKERRERVEKLGPTYEEADRRFGRSWLPSRSAWRVRLPARRSSASRS